MSDDKLGFLEESAPEAEVEEPPQQDEAQVAPEPSEPEAEPEPAQTGEQPAEPPSAPESEPQHIPLTAHLAEREKRQKAEREAEEMRRRLDALERERQATAQPQKAPDFFDNPDEAFAYRQQQLIQQQRHREFNQSKWRVQQAVGDADLVEQAEAEFAQAVQRNPHLYQEMLQHPEPYHYVVEWSKREKFLREVQDPDKWREQEREKIRQELLANAQPQPTTAPPPSMATAPSTGQGGTAPGNAFDALFSG